MTLLDNAPNCICVYKITNVQNGKSIIGSTTNLYNRIRHYRYDINKSNPLKHYNKNFLDDLIKYGLKNFTFEILEQFDNITDIELKNKETYYILKYDTLNTGYNIRIDIDGKYICNNSTKEKQKLQITSQWKNCIRDNHSNKMQNYWNNTSEERRAQQSKIMTKNLTKYSYDIYKNNEIIIKNANYQDLVKLNLETCISNFARKTIRDTVEYNGFKFKINKRCIREKRDEVFCKGYRIIRNYIK